MSYYAFLKSMAASKPNLQLVLFYTLLYDLVLLRTLSCGSGLFPSRHTTFSPHV